MRPDLNSLSFTPGKFYLHLFKICHGMILRYKDIIGTVVDKRKSLGADSWEQDTVKMHEAVKRGDQKINQMRFMVQKFMLSFNKFGLQFDDEALNDR